MAAGCTQALGGRPLHPRLPLQEMALIRKRPQEQMAKVRRSTRVFVPSENVREAEVTTNRVRFAPSTLDHGIYVSKAPSITSDLSLAEPEEKYTSKPP